MRLSGFIRANLEPILAEFEAFARSIVPTDTMDIAALRDHAHEMLLVIAHDLETPQSRQQETRKSFGHSDASGDTPDTPAQEHGSGRATSGFTVAQMVSEYRALRASVIRQWSRSERLLEASDLEDLIRFNEAIDQSLAESTVRFNEELDQTKETFLGILGHDLRTPLGAVVTSAKFMLEEGELAPLAREMTGLIVSSGERMTEMVDDLLDFTRRRLGVSMPIVRRPTDLAKVLHASVDEICAAHPDRSVKLEVSGDLRGDWDGPRLSQLLSNLISNAISHGSAATDIAVRAHGAVDLVTVTVHNYGPVIPKDQYATLFNPLTRGKGTTREASHLGLGLYIAQQIANGHGGSIEVGSDETDGTTFIVRLPRRAAEHTFARERNHASPRRTASDHEPAGERR